MQETLLMAVVLGVVQGATEFAPVSSSGHLVVVPWLVGWPTPSIAFDVMLHLGTLVAVAAYFRRDLGRIVVGILGGGPSEDVPTMRRLALLLAAGTVPGALAGALLGDFFEAAFAMPLGVGAFFIATGVLLVATERWAQRLAVRRSAAGRATEQAPGETWTAPRAGVDRSAEDVRALDALVVGSAQAIAILPGISRSGATICAGMLRGLSRDEAARFSFLLSIPIILGAAAFKLEDLVDVGLDARTWPVALAGLLSAAVSGYACIHLLLPYLRKRSLGVFAAYCLGAGFLTIGAALLMPGR